MIAKVGGALKGPAQMRIYYSNQYLAHGEKKGGEREIPRIFTRGEKRSGPAAAMPIKGIDTGTALIN